MWTDAKWPARVDIVHVVDLDSLTSQGIQKFLTPASAAYKWVNRIARRESLQNKLEAVQTTALLEEKLAFERAIAGRRGECSSIVRGGPSHGKLEIASCWC